MSCFNSLVSSGMRVVLFVFGVAISQVAWSPARAQVKDEYDVPDQDGVVDAEEQPNPTYGRDIELEKARLDVARARAEADKAQAENERMKAQAQLAAKNDVRNIRKENNFTINPLGLVFGGISIGYYRGLAGVMTLGLRAVYIPPLLPFVDFHAVGGEFSILFWPRHPNNGFYVGPLVQVSKTFPTESNLIGVLAVTPGAELGWRWIWRNGFNIGLGAGFGWAFGVMQDSPCPSGATCYSVGTGATFMLNFDLGYAF